MASLHKLAFCLILTICLTFAASFRVKRQIRQGDFSCPQPNGTFAYSPDCSKFYQCGNNQATLMTCATPLLFNSQLGYCDWPAIVEANPGGCTPPARNTNDHSICGQQPQGRDLQPGWAWSVAHPSVCNAFYTCGPAYLFAPCTFCPEDMYYDPNLGSCEPMYNNPPQNFCNGKQYVDHKYKVYRQLDGTCWPYSNIPNPYQVLADKLAAEGKGPGNRINNNNSNYRPGNNNNNNSGYNPNNNNSGYNPNNNNSGFNPNNNRG